MRSIFLILFLVFTALAVKSQPELSSNNRKAVKLFQDGIHHIQNKEDDKAYLVLKACVKEDPAFFEALLTLADVCLDLSKHEEAQQNYAAAAKLRSEKFPPMYLRWAQADMARSQYGEAIIHLEKFLSFTKINEESRKKGERFMRNSRFAEKAILNPVPFSPQNLGPEINSIYSEYHPSITVDEQTIVYTRMRPADGETDNGGAQVEEDFFMSIRKDGKWLPSISVGPPLNTHGNEGAHSLSPDGRFIFFTGCERQGGFGSCDLYISEYRGKKWKEPVNLGEAVNSTSWEAQPTISADGQELIFVSKRKEGKGRSDLWCSKKQANGTWGQAFNLGDSLNTEMDESGPFLHPDGQSLYFSSEGHPGMGMRDFFVSRRSSNGSWSKPVNLGYPINTPADETHMIISADGTKGYFSSDREGGIGLKDIYSFELSKEIQPRAVTFLRGSVSNGKTGSKIEARFEVIDIMSGQTMALSSSDPVTGEFLISLPSNSSYALNVNAPGYLFFSENYTLGATLKPTDVFQVNIPLTPIETGEKIVLKNIFFATGSASLEAKSQAELLKLQEFLTKNSALKIEIGGHTDDVGADEANLKLSQERAESVKKFLLEKGIAAERITAKGYGETKPVAPNTTDEGRKQNRRTEFIVLSK